MRPQSHKKIAPYRRALVRKLPRRMRVTGMIFAINGRVRVADVFESPLLFGAIKRKLLSAYILEALGVKRVRRATKSARSPSYSFSDDSIAASTSVDRTTGKKMRESYLAH